MQRRLRVCLRAHVFGPKQPYETLDGQRVTHAGAGTAMVASNSPALSEELYAPIYHPRPGIPTHPKRHPDIPRHQPVTVV